MKRSDGLMLPPAGAILLPFGRPHVTPVEVFLGGVEPRVPFQLVRSGRIRRAALDTDQG